MRCLEQVISFSVLKYLLFHTNCFLSHANFIKFAFMERCFIACLHCFCLGNHNRIHTKNNICVCKHWAVYILNILNYKTHLGLAISVSYCIFFVCHNFGLVVTMGSTYKTRKLRITSICVQKLCSIFSISGMMIDNQLPAQALKCFRNMLSGSQSISTCPMGPQFFLILIGIQALYVDWYLTIVGTLQDSKPGGEQK